MRVFALDQPLDRRTFLIAGVSLGALKIGIDLAVARLFAQPFSLSFYFVPTAAPLVSPPGAGDLTYAPASASGYWLTVVGCTLPFLTIGLALTIRRLRDAGLSGLLAIFFFVPCLKLLFFACLAALPSKVRGAVEVGAGPYRAARVDLGPVESSAARRRALALLLGVLAGDGVALASMGISVGLLGSYGWPLMVATPAIAGFVATTIYCRMWRPTKAGMFLVTLTMFVGGLVALSASAIEGFGCIVMLSPLFVGEALMGALLAKSLAESDQFLRAAPLRSSLVLVPLAFAANHASPLPPEGSLPIESAIVVHAPPDVVWKRVVSFPPLPPPTEALFRAGIAAPLAATIDGEGVGATRRCEFTTGTFVEPIDVWKPGRELSFHVTSQPDPMREWTLHAGPRPPHLDGYLQSTRGQFVLEPLPDGSTRLVGRTWYRMHMEPAGYWRMWGDAIIHAIHLRVLEHVARLAEDDVSRAGASP